MYPGYNTAVTVLLQQTNQLNKTMLFANPQQVAKHTHGVTILACLLLLPLDFSSYKTDNRNVMMNNLSVTDQQPFEKLM
jgi:hypothetical protein